MTIKRIFQFLSVDPVNLTPKYKLLAGIACFTAILLVGLGSQPFIPDPGYPLLIASMGASAVILFIMPNSPLAQPWQFFGGHLVSATVGVCCAQVFTNPLLASASAVGGSVLLMLALRCLHPPGSATALVPVIGGDAIAKLGYSFVLMPVAINGLIMLTLAIIINRWLLHYSYPSMSTGAAAKQPQPGGISTQELQKVLQNQGVYMDVTPGDLSKLIIELQQQSVKRLTGQITCADIMTQDVPALEYGTDVEEAWHIMHRRKLKAIPVLDKARRVIGIISWNDFFNCLDDAKQDSFLKKFSNFVKRTADITTTKPESVGHIMSTPVSVLSESAHIVDLIPLMSERNYGHIPIVNNENRLVGMIDQATLIAALFNQQAFAERNG